jgi:WD40 repeat protein
MKKLILVFLLVHGILAAWSQQIEVAVQKGHSGDVVMVAFNHDGKLLASAGTDNLIKLWHIPTGKEMASFISQSNKAVVALRFTNDDDFLLVKYADAVIHSWNVASSSISSTDYKGTETFVDAHQYISSDNSFTVELDRYYLRKKNTSGKRIFSNISVDISKNFNAVAVSEKNNLIVAGSGDGKAYVYDLARGKTVKTIDDHFASVNSVCFTRDESSFATASSDRSIIIWDSKTLTQQKRLSGKSFRFETLAFNHSGTQLAVGDELGRGRIVDLRSSRVRVSASKWHDQKIAALAFTVNDSSIFSGAYDNRIAKFHVAKNEMTGKEIYRNYISIGDHLLRALKSYREPYAWINTVAVSPGGNWVAYGGGWRESEARRKPQTLIVDRVDGRIQNKLKAHQGSVFDVCFIDEFSFLTAGSDGLIQWFYDAANDDYYFRKKNTGSKKIGKVMKGSGTTVLLLSDNVLFLYDYAKEQLLDSLHSKDVITAVDLKPGTNEIVFATFNNLTFANTETWHQERYDVPQAHTDKITDIAFNPTMKMVATSSWDATVKLWNTETRKLNATIVSIGLDDHIIITPDNYYYGTKNSLRGIGFKYGKQFVSPEQYDLRFNRPDIVLERIGFVPKEVIRSFNRAYQKRLQRLNFTEEMLSAEIHLPEAKLQAPSSALTTRVRDFKFSVEANDSKYKLDRLNVFVNNIPVFGIQGIDLRGKNLQRVNYPVEIPLLAGKNKIQVSCLNEKGVESLLETYEVEYIPEKQPVPNLYIAVVSVSGYKNKAMNLKYARKDGNDLVSMFKRSQWFNEVTVDTLFDSKATRENILKLRDKFMSSSVDDQVVFFVSGHGLLDSNLEFYFATHDVDFKDPASRGLRYDELEGLLDGIPARKKLLLMDACHSGEVDKSRIKVSEGTAVSKNQRGLVEYSYPADVQEEHYKIGITTSFELMQELFSNISKGSGAVVISAAAGNSFALESDEWKNGVFTYSLMNGIKTKLADRNKNGQIVVSELKDFVSKEVERLTEGAQKPTSRRENLEFDFRIW